MFLFVAKVAALCRDMMSGTSRQQVCSDIFEKRREKAAFKHAFIKAMLLNHSSISEKQPYCFCYRFPAAIDNASK